MGELKLTITVDRNGVAHVDGPLQNKLICYGLLEEARDIIRNYDPAKAPLVVTATGIPTNGKG